MRALYFFIGFLVNSVLLRAIGSLPSYDIFYPLAILSLMVLLAALGFDEEEERRLK